MIKRVAAGLMLVLSATPLYAQSEENNVLAQCRAQTQNLDQVHSCLDGYLNITDNNIDNILSFLDESLSGESRAGLQLSQRAFEQYRRQNCLWYLEFSSPRDEAEQIAKNCLVDMSRGRLLELRRLLSIGDKTLRRLQGFFVFGEERNSFQPCGGEERYWVEGALDAVGLIQQTYLSVASEQRQLLFATVVGYVDNQAQSPEGHNGVLVLSDLIGLRVPTDADCTLTTNVDELPVASDQPWVPAEVEEVSDDELDPQDEPEQQLTAYFGSWVVDCLEITGRKTCTLDVAMAPAGSEEPNVASPTLPGLTLFRSPRQSTYVELSVPQQEIESPRLIRWKVDAQVFGDILGSEMRVDQTGSRQLISEGPFLLNELLPMMISGVQLEIDVLNSVDDAGGETFTATLLGLTKALAFADDFVLSQIQ